MLPSETLFTPTGLGALSLHNRLVMAPLTRSRAGSGSVPGPAAALYYAQRASAGLIVSEGVCVSPEGVGNPRVPGLWSADQVQGWSTVTAAVHAAGGLIAAQLWHTGRASHPSLQPGGAAQVGPSAIPIDGSTFARAGRVPHERPRALETDEIPAIVASYARAAENAVHAGFDAVELHAANGYLIDQFLQDNANRRTDRYGGDVTGRVRFLVEVLDAVGERIGADRIAVRLSPSSTFQDMADSDPQHLFAHVLETLARRRLAYLHIVEPGISGAATAVRPADAIDSRWVRDRYPGSLVAAGNYDRESAVRAVGSGTVDAVAFGRAFLANPDLPARFATGAVLNEPDRDTFYSEGDEGYIDYPSLDAVRLQDEIADGHRDPAAALTAATPVGDWPLAWASTSRGAGR